MNCPKSKYILIPEFKPLFAMARCYGPEHGPLERPCLTPIDVIHDLIRQDGHDKLTVYEVLFNESTRKSSEPVQLTLDNYTLPYEEIVGGKKIEPVVMKENIPPKPVAPIIIKIPPERPFPIKPPAFDPPVVEPMQDAEIEVISDEKSEPETPVEEPIVPSLDTDAEIAVDPVEEADDEIADPVAPAEEEEVPAETEENASDSAGEESAGESEDFDSTDGDEAEEPAEEDAPATDAEQTQTQNNQYTSRKKKNKKNR